MSEIEKYYNGEIHVDFEEKTKENDFDKAVEFIVESDFNKDLNKCLDIVKELDKKDKEIERLKSIIKEVRELVKRDLSTDKVNNLIYSELLDIIGEENK